MNPQEAAFILSAGIAITGFTMSLALAIWKLFGGE
jgi:hypothetical protein